MAQCAVPDQGDEIGFRDASLPFSVEFVEPDLVPRGAIFHCSFLVVAVLPWFLAKHRSSAVPGKSGLAQALCSLVWKVCLSLSVM